MFKPIKMNVTFLIKKKQMLTCYMYVQTNYDSFIANFVELKHSNTKLIIINYICSFINYN